MSTPQEHRRLRELLGAYALDALPAQEVAGLRAHLDGCAACRAELAEIAPLAEDLRRIDPEALSELPAPPADLGERIRHRVAEDGALVRARTRRGQRRDRVRQRTRRLLTAAAAVAVLAGVGGVGTVVGRVTAPVVVATPSPSSAAIPLERVPVVTVAAGLQVSTASVIAHSWGLEARFDGTGFSDGELYRAAFRSADGALLPAGEFLGTGQAKLKCNMQSALLRSAATGFVVMDEEGRTVLSAELPA